MRSKIIIVLVAAVVAGGVGYWLGCSQTLDRTTSYWQSEQSARWRANGNYQARICFAVLTNLHAGKASEAEAILEDHLSEGISRHISSWTNPPRGAFNPQEISFIRAVREYRLQHPWTNDEPERAERLQKAFKLPD